MKYMDDTYGDTYICISIGSGISTCCLATPRHHQDQHELIITDSSHIIVFVEHLFKNKHTTFLSMHKFKLLGTSVCAVQLLFCGESAAQQGPILHNNFPP